MKKRDLRELKVAAALNTRERDYWKNRFSGEPIKSSFPYDYIKTGPQSRDTGIKELPFKWQGPLFSRLMAISRGSDHALHVVLAAALTALLSRYTGLEDITVATPVYRQAGEGQYINTVLALRTRLQSSITFKALLGLVKQTLGEAIEHQAYPVELLPELLEIPVSGGAFPLFDTALALENIHTSEYIAYMDLGMVFRFTKTPRDIDGVVVYDSLLYRKTTVEQVVAHFTRLVENALAGPEAAISTIEILSEAEKNRLLIDFNNTQTDYPKDKTIHRLFEEQVERMPDHMAVVGAALSVRPVGPVSLSYRTLNESAARLAYMLFEKGVLADNIVGIMMERSIDLIIGILGILKSGGAYLPIDPDYPQERIDYMLKDSAAKIEIGRAEVRKCSLAPSLPRFLASDSSNLAYIIYTSGSTGRPKGVLVEHRSVVNVLFSLFQAYPELPTDSFLLKTSFLFDVSVAELFGWVLGGSRLIVAGKNDHKDPKALLAVIELEEITHINFVPSMFGVFISQLNHENIKRLSSLKYIFLAGEALPSHQVMAFRELNVKIAMEDLYGPTENTVYTSRYSLSEWNGQGSIPIGKPLSNMQLYVVDNNDRLQPMGVPGELCISGLGLVRGYLNSPQLTSDKFIKNRSYKSHKTYILYKTGDLARWLMDGNIEFLGRIDQQVKIRGYRIELGEIEIRLRAHEKIKDAIVIAREDKSGDKYLCAYIVFKVIKGEPEFEKESAIAGLRDYLAGKLPDYMIPAYFLPLESIPLTPSGKVDRKTLTATEPGTSVAYTAPRDEEEERLTETWSEVLGIPKEKISIDDNFFHLGGQSLKLIMLAARIHKVFDVIIPISKFFEISTVRNLAQYMRTAAQDKYIAIDPVEKKDYYPMSSAQKRLYIIQGINPGSVNYNMPLFSILEGPMEIVRLENAFRQLIRRHESLRTSFHMVDNKPIQKIHDDVKFKIEYLEIRDQEAGSSAFICPFDLSHAPLLRAGLAKKREIEHIFMVDMHHIISDGNSLEIFLAELLALYHGKMLPELRLQYKEFAEWQAKPSILGELKKQEMYWINRLKGDLPILKLPTDYPRPGVKNFAGDMVTFEIHRDTAKKLRSLAQREEATMFMVILTIFNILLFKLDHREDIIVGTLTAGRRHPDLENIIGMFVNTLVLRNYPKKSKTFIEFLREVKKITLEAFDHQDYPFDELVDKLEVKRDTARNPLFDVLFLFNSLGTNNESKMEIPGLKIKPYNDEYFQSKFDILFTGSDSGETENLFFAVEYSTELFKREKIERLISYFRDIISAVEKNEYAVLKDIGLTHDLASAASDLYRKTESDFEF